MALYPGTKKGKDTMACKTKKKASTKKSGSGKKKPCQEVMHLFSRGDIVYLYLFNLKDILNSVKKVNKHRFGRIKEINKIEAGNDIYHEYKIELLDGYPVTVKEYVGAFKICNMTELQTTILESSELTDTEKDILIEQVKESLELIKAK